MRSGNPALNEKTFDKHRGLAKTSRMTMEGTVNKTFILFAILFGAAFYVWNLYFSGQNVTSYMMAGLVGGGILGLITGFVPRISPITAPFYAVLEGVALGAISASYESQYNGIVLQAVLITFSIFIALLFLYKIRLIKVTHKFRLGVAAATLGIVFVYLIDIILRFFNMEVPYIHSNGLIGIGISLVIIAIATLNLVLDFDFIEQGTRNYVPKYMEWYGAFGLMVTLVWLYIEILRLLTKMKSRD